MKLSKKLVAVLLLVVLVVSLAACSSNSVVGVWQMDIDSVLTQAGISKADYEMVKAMGFEMEATMEFTKDGKAIMKVTAMGQTQTQEGKYEVKGDKLILDGDESTFKINGNKLTITSGSVVLNMTKK